LQVSKLINRQFHERGLSMKTPKEPLLLLLLPMILVAGNRLSSGIYCLIRKKVMPHNVGKIRTSSKENDGQKKKRISEKHRQTGEVNAVRV